MNNLAYQELYLGQYFTLEEQIKQIEKVSFNDVMDVANILQEKNFSITILGPVSEKDLSVK